MPDDTAKYNSLTHNVSVTVNKANAVITEITCDNKTYNGIALVPSSTVTTGTGTIVYTYSGTGIVDGTSIAPSGAGNYIVTATLAASANYNAATKTKDVAISKADQAALSITGKPAAPAYGDSFTLSTSGGSGTGGLSWGATGGATVDSASGEVTVNGVAEVTITATKAGDSNYNQATATYTFTPAKADPSITAWPTVSAITYGQTFANAISGGSASVVGSFSIADAATVPTVSGSPYAKMVTFTPDNTTNYNSLTHGVSVTVNKADQAVLIITDKPASPAYENTFTLTTSGGSGTGSISWGATGGATVDSASGEVTINGMAEVTVTATKAGDSIRHGQTFADAISGGSASVEGSFTIEDATVVPAVSTTPYDKTVTFTPDDSAKYNILTHVVAVTVKSKSSPTTTTTTNTVVEVNGEKQDAGTSSTTTNNGQTVTTVTVDDNKLNTILEQKGNNATVTIPVSNTDVAVGVLTGQMVKNMETKEAVLEIATGNVTYTLPASQININNVSEQIGQQVELKDIQVSITVSSPPDNTVRVVEDTANKNNYQLVVQPVQFEITCTSGDKSVSVSKFNGYVERTVAIPEEVDPSKITTGVVLNADGTFTHVPTTIILIDGKYYAKINSLTNSTYTVIYNPIEFADVANHWAKTAINDMGSRLVVTGVGNNNYDPASDITRAEFAGRLQRRCGQQMVQRIHQDGLRIWDHHRL